MRLLIASVYDPLKSWLHHDSLPKYHLKVLQATIDCCNRGALDKRACRYHTVRTLVIDDAVKVGML